MLRLIVTGLLLSGTVATSMVEGAAQVDAGGEPRRPSGADSARVHRTARSEQADFERFRRRRLPETWPRSRGFCDERIGRFCLTHDDGVENWIAPPEKPEVVAARLALIDHLTEASHLLPGDGWIAGQRVRYLVEARRFDEAAAAATECRADMAWCAALSGFTLHYAARPAEADSAFSLALSRMEEHERARWNDLSLILEDSGARTYRRLDPSARASFEERFWRLADPLISQPGNELRAEHLARQVIDQFQDRAQSPDGNHWGSDLREILIRYGWPYGWERTRSTGLQWAQDASFIAHFSSAPQYLLPPSTTLTGDTSAIGIWDLELRRARTGYDVPLADSVARWFFPLAHQVAVFRRGADALVAAVYELPADSTPSDAQSRAGLALLPTLDPLLPPEITLQEGVGRKGALMTSAPARPLLVSLEVLIPEERRLTRARHEVSLAPLEPGEIAISDLLLIGTEAPLPDSLPAALDRALSSARVAAGDEIGIYWEMYGLMDEKTPSVTMSLRLMEEETGWLRRLAQRAGLLREVVPIRLRWEEPVAPGEISARSLALRVPEVSPGSYTLELTSEIAGAQPLSAHREIEIVGAQ